MTTRTDGPLGGSHDSHDRILVAAHAAGDLAGPELARSERLLASCPDCRGLHDELLSIAAATRHLPAPARPADTDFRISPDRAAALARGGLWRRLLRPFGRGSGTVRPLATAFTTLGLAGLMLAALPALQLGASTGSFISMNAESEAPRDAGATVSPEAVGPDAASPLPSDHDTAGGEGSTDSGAGYGPADPTTDDKGAEPTQGTTAQGGGAPPDADGEERTGGLTDGAGGPTPLVLLSAGLLAAGLGLFLLRQAALRVR